MDENHAVNQKYRRSQTGVLLFINRYTINWYSKRQKTLEAISFGAQFYALKAAFEMVESLRYKYKNLASLLTDMPMYIVIMKQCARTLSFLNQPLKEASCDNLSLMFRGRKIQRINRMVYL